MPPSCRFANENKKSNNSLLCFSIESNKMKLRCLLDRKRLVCDFASAMVNKSQLQTAQCWRADFIFDPSDLHKLLVLGDIQQGFH